MSVRRATYLDSSAIVKLVVLPPELRSLDAIHLATASLLGDSLGKVVTYDTRMAEAARGLGWSVVAPA
jgi:uncharacterized protein